jgi:two-component system NarL family sensor kinase
MGNWPGVGHDGCVAVRAHRRAGAVLAVLSTTIATAALIGGFAMGQLPFTIEETYPNAVFGVLFPAVGALVLARVPGHRLGWLYGLSGLASALTLAAYAYGRYALITHPGSLPAGVAVGWVSSWIWVCGFSPLATFGILLFPDGHLPSRRWWPVAALATGGVALPVFANAFRPGPLTNHPVHDNPLGLPLGGQVFERIGLAGFALLVAAVVGALAAMAVRWWRADRQGRHPLNWFLLAAGLLALAYLPPHGIPAVDAATGLLKFVAPVMLPVAIAVAVLRDRLYGPAPAVRRSLIYAALLTCGLATYATTVLVLDLSLRGRASALVTLAATATVAVLFQPLRLRVEHSVDRLLYGERDDPYVVLSRLGERVEHATGDEGLLGEIAHTVATTLRLPYAAVRQDGDPPGTAPAAYGEPRGPLHEVALVCQGEPVGTLVVGQRAPDEAFTAAELRLFDDVGRQAAVAARAVQLARDLQASRQRLVTALEEERRRIRRDLHDGLGPALAGVALGLDAARNLMDNDPTAADELLRQLKIETQSCVTDIRRLVYALRPPALDELGLLPALLEYAVRLDGRDAGFSVAVEARGPLPQLPAAVEAAAYRIGVEALTNVARHAHARHCVLRLEMDNLQSALLVRVTDDGIGILTSRPPGVGLAAMAERAAELGGSCHLAAGPAGGTDLIARLPLPTA